MSERFYQQTELSNSDFRRFDVLLQEQDVKDGTADLYALDYVRSVSQNPSVQKNLTNKVQSFKQFVRVYSKYFNYFVLYSNVFTYFLVLREESCKAHSTKDPQV